MRISCAALLCFGLAACGGGATSTAYQTLSSSGAAQSVMAGTAIRSNGATGALELTSTTGTLTHDTGAATLSDGTYTLVDPDGPNGTLYTDGAATAQLDDTITLSTTYDYVQTYRQSYRANGVQYDSTGLFGVATRAADMPASAVTTAKASYQGQAWGLMAINANGMDLNDASATLTVDFATQTLDLEMTDFTFVNQITLKDVTGPMDTISATGTQMTGATFTGGTITTSLAGEEVSVVGKNVTTAGQGQFFGIDASGIGPDEAGGHLLLQGDEARIITTFVVD